MADGLSVPSVPDPNSCGAKLALLWLTNKPLAIFLIFLATALVIGIIFVIVWFAIIVPGQKKNPQETAKVADASATYTVTPPAQSSTSTSSSSSTTPASSPSSSSSSTTPASSPSSSPSTTPAGGSAATTKPAHFMRLRHN